MHSDALYEALPGDDNLSLNPLVQEQTKSNEDERKVLQDDEVEGPNMYAVRNLGLYCQYAAAGLLYGSGGSTTAFCVYYFNGPSNVCSNAQGISFFAWNLKLVFAVIVDCIHPFGSRRKFWFLFSYTGVLSLLLFLALACDKMDASQWLSTLLCMQLMLMFATVPADGYSIELGQLEPLKSKGNILVTGQRIFFVFCVVASVIQTLLTNGPATNEEGCQISWDKCWSWGLTPNQYYGLLFVLVLCLTAPMLFFQELSLSSSSPPPPPHSLSELLRQIWATMHSLTTLNILIFVVGIGALTNFQSQVNIFLQYYIIALTNVQAGIDNITSYLALVLAIWVFQTYLLNRDWRRTQYSAVIFGALLGLFWIPAYYNMGGLRNGWYTIFINLDQSFVNGLTQVIYSLAVMELARPGLEATTYELVVTVGNAACALSGIFATQLLGPMSVVGCTASDDDAGEGCAANSVNLHSATSFENSGGPVRFTKYCLVLCGVAVAAAFFFTPFLPRDKEQCHEWKRLGEQRPSAIRPYVTFFLAATVVLYGLVASVLLLNSSTSCLEIVGGEGC